MLLYPVLRYILPPPQAEAAASAVVAGKTKDFPPNSGKVVRFGDPPGHRGAPDRPGSSARFSAVCTHLQCTVQYRADLELVWCACHNGRFDLTGRNVGGPPPRPLDQLEVAVRGDDVVVSRKS